MRDLFSHVVTILALYIAQGWWSNTAWFLLAQSMVATLLYACLFQRALRKRAGSPIQYTYIILGLIILGMGGGLVGIKRLQGDDFVFINAVVDPADIAAGANAFSLYILGVMIGIRAASVGRATGRQQASPRTLSQRSWVELGVVFVVGVCVNVFSSFFFSLGQIAGGARFFHLAAGAFLALHAPAYLGRSRTVRLGCMLMVSVALVVVCAISGSKLFIVLALAPLVIFLAKEFSSPFVLGMSMVAVAVTFVFFITPLISMARLEQGGTDGVTLTVLLDAARRIDSAQETTAVYGVSGDWLDSTTDRIYYPKTIAFIVSEVAQGGLRLGQGLEYLQWGLIPRFLWSDKPIVTRGGWFSTYLGLAGSEASASTSTGMTAAGELYWQFGLVGVGIGGILLGYLKQALLGLLCGPRLTGSLREWVCAVTITCTVIAEDGEFGSSLLLLIGTAVTLFLYGLVLRRSRV